MSSRQQQPAPSAPPSHYVTRYGETYVATATLAPYVSLSQRNSRLVGNDALPPVRRPKFAGDSAYTEQFGTPKMPNYSNRFVAVKEATGYNRNVVESVLPTEASTQGRLADDTEYSARYARMCDRRPCLADQQSAQFRPRMEDNGYVRNERFVPDQFGWKEGKTSARTIAHLPLHLQKRRLKADHLQYHGDEHESVSHTSYSFSDPAKGRGEGAAAELGVDVDAQGDSINRPSLLRVTPHTSTVRAHGNSGFKRCETAPYDGVGTLSMQLLQHGVDRSAGDIGRVAKTHTSRQLRAAQRADPTAYKYMMGGSPAYQTTSSLLLGKDPHSFSNTYTRHDIAAAEQLGAPINANVLAGRAAGSQSAKAQLTGKDAGSGVAGGSYTGALAGIAGFPERRSDVRTSLYDEEASGSAAPVFESGGYRSTYSDYRDPVLHVPAQRRERAITSDQIIGNTKNVTSFTRIEGPNPLTQGHLGRFDYETAQRTDNGGMSITGQPAVYCNVRVVQPPRAPGPIRKVLKPLASAF